MGFQLGGIRSASATSHENALKPARHPYESQHLAEGDAARERQRCEAVKMRLSLLHAHLDAVARDHAHAA
jgi:hypothetical protein